MELKKVGRKRKSLVEKSTSIILRIDNKTLFDLCDKTGIDFDRNATIFDDETIGKIKVEITKIIGKFVN